jgi:hypothetical protein
MTTNAAKSVARADAGSLRKSWLLLIGQMPGMTPLRLLGLALLVFVSASAYLGAPLVTAVMAAYLLAIANYLVRKQEQELMALREVLACSDTVFQTGLESLRMHPRIALTLCWLAGTLAMFVINFNASSMVAVRQGVWPTPPVLWSWFIALFFWVGFAQLLVITVSNSRTFDRMGRQFATIDLLDTGGLVPFARVGIRNILIFVGGYALVPIIYFEEQDFTLEVLISLAIFVPISIALLIMPMNSIRDRISKEKHVELARIQSAMHGDRSALAESPISRDASYVGFTGLVLYRQMINEINEWPIDYPVFLRLGLYIVIPLLTWFGAAIVERLVQILI